MIVEEKYDNMHFSLNIGFNKDAHLDLSPLKLDLSLDANFNKLFKLETNNVAIKRGWKYGIYIAVVDKRWDTDLHPKVLFKHQVLVLNFSKNVIEYLLENQDKVIRTKMAFTKKSRQPDVIETSEEYTFKITSLGLSKILQGNEIAVQSPGVGYEKFKINKENLDKLLNEETIQILFKKLELKFRI